MMTKVQQQRNNQQTQNHQNTSNKNGGRHLRSAMTPDAIAQRQIIQRYHADHAEAARKEPNPIQRQLNKLIEGNSYYAELQAQKNQSPIQKVEDKMLQGKFRHHIQQQEKKIENQNLNYNQSSTNPIIQRNRWGISGVAAGHYHNPHSGTIATGSVQGFAGFQGEPYSQVLSDGYGREVGYHGTLGVQGHPKYMIQQPFGPVNFVSQGEATLGGGFRGGGHLSGGWSPNGIVASGGMNATAGFWGSGSSEFAFQGNTTSAGIRFSTDAMIGAHAMADARLRAGRDGVAAGGQFEAGAGAGGRVGVGVFIARHGQDLASIMGYLEGHVGAHVGGHAEFHFSSDNMGFDLGGDITLGFGSGGGLHVHINPQGIARFGIDKLRSFRARLSQSPITPPHMMPPQMILPARLYQTKAAYKQPNPIQRQLDKLLEGNSYYAEIQAQKNQQQPIQKQEKANNTGLPNNLKSGIENLSGYSMDDVKVHYNSDQPAQLNAHAYAQGTDIHLATGQEKHLPHEAWHVVQQKQGRVKPTMQMKDKVSINDDAGLEKEADIMGAKAIQFSTNKIPDTVTSNFTSERPIVQQKKNNLKAIQGNSWENSHSIIQRRIHLTNKGYRDDYVKKLLKEREETMRKKGGKSLIGMKEWSYFLDILNSDEEFEFKNLAELETYITTLDDKIISQLGGTQIDLSNGDDVFRAFRLTLNRRLGKQHLNRAIVKQYSEETRQAHLIKFKENGGHAFIADWIYQNQIRTDGKAWGWADPTTKHNFISTIAAADTLAKKAAAEKGVTTLERELGLPKGSWSNEGEINHIYRFIIKSGRIEKGGATTHIEGETESDAGIQDWFIPEMEKWQKKQVKIHIADGTEGGAYQREWLGGGKTLKGIDEAVIHGFNDNNSLREAVKAGIIIIKKLTFNSEAKSKTEREVGLPKS